MGSGFGFVGRREKRWGRKGNRWREKNNNNGVDHQFYCLIFNTLRRGDMTACTGKCIAYAL